MMLGSREKKAEYVTFYFTLLERKSPTPSENFELKKSKFFPGYEPGLPRQNAIALPFAPPTHHFIDSFVINSTHF